MKRRKAISLVALTSGTMIVGPSLVVSSCEPAPYKYDLFTYGDNEIINAIGEIILPKTTETPGAEAANVADFIQSYVTDCLAKKHQSIFLQGYQAFKLSVQEKLNEAFDDLDKEMQEELVSKLIDETLEWTSKDPHYFVMLKQLVLRGYFTSEIGAKQALRYVPIPQYQQGVIDYTLGDKAWAL